jgi:LuxR family transcriptional regulator, maltose regulon positive regulatory protein
MTGFASSKFAPPGTDGLIHRPRLYRHVDDACSRPLIWITGPPGTGKTMLVAGYVKSRDFPFIWYRFDETDNDPAVFFSSLDQAARPIMREKNVSLPVLAVEYHKSLTSFTTYFFEQLFKTLPDSFFLVLENFHLLEDEQGTRTLLIGMLSLMPAGARTIITSRSYFPKALTKMEVERKISFLSWEELRFTPTESRALLGADEFADEVFHLLHEKTGGWAAGLVLFGESLRRGGKIQGSEVGATPWIPMREVFDYFAVELYQKIRPDLKEFLIKTSFLSSMTIDMATTMTGSRQAGEILYQLYRNNYLTSCHVSRNPEYEYHPLFSRFLQHMASNEYPPRELNDLRCRAAAILESSGKLDQAVALFKSAGDHERLASLILHHAKGLVAKGHFGVLKKWLSMLPVAYQMGDPWLTYWLAACRSTEDPVSSRELFGRAFDRFRESEDHQAMLSAWCGAVETFIYDWDDFHPLDGWIESLESLLREGILPGGELRSRTALCMAMALSYRRPEHPDFRTWLEKAMDRDRGEFSGYLMPAMYYAAHHHMWSGDFGRFRETAGTFIQAVQDVNVPIFHVLIARCMEAALHSLCSLKGELALESVQGGLELADRYGMHFWNFLLLGQGVFAALTMRDPGMAGNYLARMEAAVRGSSRFAQGYFHYSAAMVHCSLEEHALAEPHVKSALEIAQKAGARHFTPYFELAMAQVCHETGDQERAEDLMDQLARFINASGATMQEYMWLICRAHFDLNRGLHAQGLEALRKAFALGRAQGYLNMFLWWRPQVMARLCAEALKNGIEVDYAKSLIRQRNLSPDPLPLEAVDRPSKPESLGGVSWTMPETAPVRIQTFGSFRVFVHDRQVYDQVWRGAKSKTLLKALIVNGGTNVPRDALLDMLWPDSDGDMASNNLKVMLSRVRKIGSTSSADPLPWLLVRHGEISLSREHCSVDCLRFRESLVKAMSRDEEVDDLKLALDMYTDDFLPRDVSDGWIVHFREDLRELYLRGVLRLSGNCASARRDEEALPYLQRAVQMRFVNEQLYARLMKAYIDLGYPSMALQVFRKARGALKTELDILPGPALISFARLARQAQQASRRQTP